MVNGNVTIDCAKLNLLGGHDTAQTITGLYTRTKKAIETGKPIIAENCVYGENVPMTPVNVFAIIESDVLILTSSILQIRIAKNSTNPDNGDVTIYNLVTDFPSNTAKRK